MPLAGSWIAANLLIRVLFRANIYSIFIRLFTNTVIFVFTVIATTKAVHYYLMVYNDKSNKPNGVRWFCLLSPYLTSFIEILRCWDIH